MSNTSQDRSRVAASDPNEVRYFGKKHGLTDDQVKDLIKQHGNDRKTLEAAVATMKGPATTGSTTKAVRGARSREVPDLRPSARPSLVVALANRQPRVIALLRGWVPAAHRNLGVVEGDAVRRAAGDDRVLELIAPGVVLQHGVGKSGADLAVEPREFDLDPDGAAIERFGDGHPAVLAAFR